MTGRRRTLRSLLPIGLIATLASSCAQEGYDSSTGELLSAEEAFRTNAFTLGAFAFVCAFIYFANRPDYKHEAEINRVKVAEYRARLERIEEQALQSEIYAMQVDFCRSFILEVLRDTSDATATRESILTSLRSVADPDDESEDEVALCRAIDALDEILASLMVDGFITGVARDSYRLSA